LALTVFQGKTEDTNHKKVLFHMYWSMERLRVLFGDDVRSATTMPQSIQSWNMNIPLPSFWGVRSVLIPILGCILWIGLGMTLFTCQPESPSPGFRFGLATAPTNFDPRFATDAASARINRLLYERLVDFDDRFQPIPALARWTEISPRHYRFVLNSPGSTFHDGTPVTATDVKATYEFILDPENLSAHRMSLTLIESIETPNSHTIDFYLTRPEPLFPSYLVIGILPARLVGQKHPFQTNPIGSGPFAFRERPNDTELHLTRLADNQMMKFLHIPDPTVRVLKFLAGEIDMMQNDLPPELVEYLAQQEGVHIQRHPGSNFSYLGFNLQHPLTQQLPIRQAIAHAIDREALIHYVLGDGAQPAAALLLPTHWAGHPALTGYSYNPSKAQSLLAQAGYTPANPLRLTYKTSSDPFRIRIATIIQDQLARVGIHVDLRSYDWGTFYGDIKAGRFEMYSLSWVGIHTPDIFSYVFHSRSIPPKGANRGRFVDKHADDLMNQAELALTLRSKKNLYQQLQAYLLEALPYIPLWYQDHVFIAQENLKGYRVAIDGNYDSLADVHWGTSQNKVAY
jgi:peptide/nickel transport system substrate-binding protein